MKKKQADELKRLQEERKKRGRTISPTSCSARASSTT